MGFEIQRFQGDVDEEFICTICTGVLEDPLQAPACEHVFCRSCITEWISRQPTCPVDRQPVTASQLRPVPRLLRNFLSRLCTSCDYAPHGCNAVLQLDSLASHLVKCEFNPKKPTPCEAGCGLVIPRGELAEHNCVRELRALIATHEQELSEHQRKMNDSEQELAELKRTHQIKLNEYKQKLAEQQRTHQRKLYDYEKELSEHKKELALLKKRSEIEREEAVRWSNSLTPVTVSRWYSRLTCPGDVIKMKVKESLSESGCPPHILCDLMDNCHVGRWPPGLKSLFEVQRNIRKYVYKRVPGQPAVVVLHCDNAHVDQSTMMKVKESLSESGCPPHILCDLMDNCHVGRWPPGLKSLFEVQRNIRKYVYKRVPGQPAVVVLHCDNAHVDQSTMVNPGFVMIFDEDIK